MDKVIERTNWLAFCKEFSKKNYQRVTQLQTLDEEGSRLEENGVPLEGIDLDDRDDNGPCVEIMLSGEGADERHMCHTVQHVRRLVAKMNADGTDQVLEIEDETGVRTLLHLKDIQALAS